MEDCRLETHRLGNKEEEVEVDWAHIEEGAGTPVEPSGLGETKADMEDGLSC